MTHQGRAGSLQPETSFGDLKGWLLPLGPAEIAGLCGGLFFGTYRQGNQRTEGRVTALDTLPSCRNVLGKSEQK